MQCDRLKGTMKKTISAFLLIILISWPTLAMSYDLATQVKSFTLKNGMKWLVVTRPQAPVFSGVIMVRVGGADEETGKTGLAHMFEHMAFKGSDKLGTKDYEKEKIVLQNIEQTGAQLTAEKQKRRPDGKQIKTLSAKMQTLGKEAAKYQIKNEVWEVLSRNGAKGVNAYTSKDVTAFYSSMPANRIDLWARIMSEMIFAPALREFYTERDVVQQERRMGVESDPDGALSELLLSSAFTNGPYHWSTIGYEKDIEGLTIKDAREFHKRYYVPSNMVGVIVGDISVGKARRVMRKVFGGFPPADIPKAPTSAGEHAKGIRRTLHFKSEPSLAIAYHKPTLPNPLEYTFDVITSLLCHGRTSRLQKELVFTKKIAKDVYCSDGYPGSRLDNLFLIWIDPLNSHSPKKVARAAESVIAGLRNKPVSQAELDKVRKRVTVATVMSLDKNIELAQALARFEVIFGDWKLLADYPKRIAEVNAQDVLDVARKYLKPSDRIVVERVR
jgi:predicted Zn-dependent peptidase